MAEDRRNAAVPSFLAARQSERMSMNTIVSLPRPAGTPHTRNRLKHSFRGLALIAVTALALTACGSADADESPSANTDSGAGSSPQGVDIPDVGTVEIDPAVAELLPERYADGLKLASTIPHPPFIDFEEPGVTDRFVGVDYDLLVAIGAKMGTTVTYNAQPFDGLIPGLQAGKFDVITGLADLKERQQTVTFVDYSKTGAAILVRTGHTGIDVIDDLCGVKVAAGKATTLQQLLADFSETSCGDNPIKIIEYPDETSSIQALISGATDALLSAKVNALNLAKELPDKLEAIEDPNERNGYKANPNGIGVLNENADLADAIQAALQSLIDDGTYLEIYKKWELDSIGVSEAVINGATN